MGEVWKKIDGFDGNYEVSNLGRVRSWAPKGRYKTRPKEGRILSLGGKNAPYLWVPLRSAKQSRYPSVHLLVAEAFVGPRPDGCEVNHKNGQTHDNRAENLEWVTKQQNEKHAADVLGKGVGARNPSAKLSDDQVAAIREAYASGSVSQYLLARISGVSQTQIGRIVRIERWDRETMIRPNHLD